jgi:hypothetical protein
VTDWYASLDLSLTSTGGVAVPAGWGGDFGLVERMTTGQVFPKGHRPSPLELQQRICEVAQDCADFLFWLSDGDPDKITVFVEDLPRHSGFSVVELAMLRGALIAKLTTFHIVLVPVALSTARSTLLGTIPRGEKGDGTAKKAVQATVLEMSGGNDSPFESGDELDAFCVLNHGLSLAEPREYFLVLPPKPRESRKRSASSASPATSTTTGAADRTGAGSAGGAARRSSRRAARGAETPPASTNGPCVETPAMPDTTSSSETAASAPSADSTPAASSDVSSES